MDAAHTVEHRLRSHLLSAPSATLQDAASHMLAVQSQEFWGGRWALATRTRGRVVLSDVDAAFDRGELVRSWTMRGTIHTIPAGDLGWMLSVTSDRQIHQASATHRREGIDDADVVRAEALVRIALRGGNRLARKEVFEVLDAGGVSTAGQRGYHLLTRLSMHQVVCQGPVVPREGSATREQYFVLCDEWVTGVVSPTDPAAEMFTRYIASHAPAGVRDFAWWSGLTLGASRAAARAAGDRVVVIDEDSRGEARYVAGGSAPQHSPEAPQAIALPPFEEYYIPYVDRTAVCDPAFLTAIGPGKNGMVRAIIVARGQIVGVWKQSTALGRHADDPTLELFEPDAASENEVASALSRYREFILN
ncbi:winged helix DNA-binding domain-containing protein (plasmid) [Coraliomargarita sp. W4R53]